MSGRFRWPSGRTCRPEHSALWLRRVAAMLAAGVPASRAVRVAGEGSVRAVRLASEEIARGLEAGIPLDRLMERFPGLFPGYVTGMAASGYAHGRLDSALLAAADQLRWDCELKRRVVAASVYPAATLAVLVGVALVVSFVAVPAFEQLYASVGARLPAITRALVAFSRAVREAWWALLGAAVAGAAVLADPVAGQRPRAAVARLATRVPLFGEVLVKTRAARALRTVAKLYESGIVLTRCLEIAAEASQDPEMRAKLMRAADLVARGMPVSAATAASGAFDAQTVEMIRAGEESGRLGGCLLDAAVHLEEEADHAARIAVSVMEPVAALVVGLAALGCALALYLPVFEVPGLVMRR